MNKKRYLEKLSVPDPVGIGYPDRIRFWPDCRREGYNC